MKAGAAAGRLPGAVVAAPCRAAHLHPAHQAASCPFAAGPAARKCFGRRSPRGPVARAAEQPGAVSSEDRAQLERSGAQEPDSAATVVENKAVSVDGSLRLLTLSVEDKVRFLEGRSMHRKQERPRWADAYKAPGQFVAVRLPEQGTGPPEPEREQRLLAIASSPYAVRRESADLDASIIEVLVDRQGPSWQQPLAELGPGQLVQVSRVRARGFEPLLSMDGAASLQPALEQSRNLLLIGVGAAGIAPLRAVLEWAPVQAHATAHSVTLLYACGGPTAAAFLKDWDTWREAGVTVRPVYLEGEPAAGFRQPSPEWQAALQERLLRELLGGEQGLAGLLGGDPRAAAVLLAGGPAAVLLALYRELHARGVSREHVLVCQPAA